MSELKRQLATLPENDRIRLNRLGGLTIDGLIREVSTPTLLGASLVEPAVYVEVTDHTAIDVEHVRLGEEAIVNQQVGVCLLAGGAGTRVGGPKWKLFDAHGQTLLRRKLDDLQSFNVPTFIMCAPGDLVEIGDFVQYVKESLHWDVEVFSQFESCRLAPDNTLIRDKDNNMEFYPTGHGDFPAAFVASGTAHQARMRGIHHVVVCNVDNLKAGPDAAVIGKHMASGGHGVTCEVVQRQQGDSGGVLAWVDGSLQVLESFMLPDNLTANDFIWHNTNTMVLSIDAITIAANREQHWHRVRKQVEGRIVVQYERLLQQLTVDLVSRYVGVPRKSRFEPIKTIADLLKAQQ